MLTPNYRLLSDASVALASLAWPTMSNAICAPPAAHQPFEGDGETIEYRQPGDVDAIQPLGLR